MVQYDKLDVGAKVIVKTKNSTYILEKVDDSRYDTYISGGYFERKYGRKFKVHINGCTYGGSMLAIGKIEVDMILEAVIEESNRTLTTSRIKDVEVV